MPKLSTLISLNEQAALETANGPSGSNPYATMQDLLGLDGVDQVARDQAAAAQETADQAQETADQALAAAAGMAGAKTFTWVGSAPYTATIDLSQGNLWIPTNRSAAGSPVLHTLTLTNGADGKHGVFYFWQNNQPNTLSIVAAGRTVAIDLNVGDVNPFSMPDSFTEYHYLFFTLGGVERIRVYKVFLQP